MQHRPPQLKQSIGPPMAVKSKASETKSDPGTVEASTPRQEWPFPDRLLCKRRERAERNKIGLSGARASDRMVTMVIVVSHSMMLQSQVALLETQCQDLSPYILRSMQQHAGHWQLWQLWNLLDCVGPRKKPGCPHLPHLPCFLPAQLETQLRLPGGYHYVSSH